MATVMHISQSAFAIITILIIATTWGESAEKPDESKSTSSNLSYFEAHALPAPSKSKAVLVLLTDISKPGLPLEQKDWTEFADSNQLALLSIGFKQADGIRDKDAIGRELAEKIDQSVAEKFGKNLKRIGYSRGWGGEWFLRAVQASPEKWSFWSVVDAPAYPIFVRRDRENLFPPGLVMESDPAHFVAAREFFMDIRKINPEKQRAALVGSNKDQLDSVFLDRFFRQYVSSLYSNGKEKEGYWLSNHGDEKPPPKDGKPWIHHSWFPSVEIGGAWQLLNRERDAPLGPATEIVKIETRIGEQDLVVRIPGELVANSSRPAKSVIIWLTQRKEGEDLTKVVGNQSDPLIRWAELNQIPIVAWNSRSVWDKDFLQNSAEVNADEVARSDADFIAVGDSIVNEVRKLAREKGWPTDRDWLLATDTSASRLGLMMAQAYPFLAVQLHSATGFEDLARQPESPWLLTSGWSDGGMAESLKFYNQANRNFLPVIFRRFPDSGHRTQWEQRYLAASFFDSILSLRAHGGSQYPWAGDWEKPALPEEFQIKISKDEEGNEVSIEPELPDNFDRNVYAPERPRPKTLGEWFSESLRRPYLVGDLRRGTLSGPADQTSVPGVWRVKLSDWKLAEAWSLHSGEFPPLSENEQANLEGYLKRVVENEKAEAAERDLKKETQKGEGANE